MEHITRKTNNLKILIVVVALAAFSTVFLLTGAVLTAVYGVELGSPDYKQYYKYDGTELDFETNLLINSCIYTETPNLMILDSRGLIGTMFDQSNIFSDSDHNALDPCKKIADKFIAEAGWRLQEVDRSEGETVITLVK